MEISKIQKFPVAQNFGSSRINKAYVQKQDFSVNFGNKDEDDKDKKGGINGKKLTNVVGTIAGIAIITSAAIYMKKSPAWRKIFDKAEGDFSKKVKAAQTDYADTVKMTKGEMKEGNWLYKLGYKTNGLVEKLGGEELSNNILYGIGTVGVMPLVIAYSPFGKKNSSKEDKKFAILRQPLSFATMFSIQLTNDKVFSRWSKSAIAQNILEDKELLKDGTNKFKTVMKNNKEVIDDSILDKIKFNDGVLKESFKEKCKELLGDKNITSSEEEILYKMKDPVGQVKKLKEYLHAKSVNPETIEKVAKNFQRYANASGKSKCVTETVKILNNVVISQVIGCTLLNVIYGKVMKARTNKNEKKAEQAVIQKKLDSLLSEQKAERRAK